MIVKGLKRMEYRGYDSVGVATLNNDKIQVKKDVGKVAEVNEKQKLDQMPGLTGIGHTRWATHGVVSERNAHPHIATTWSNVVVVHNGIIDNYQELKQSLSCEFVSETDSEVIANLLGFHFSQTHDAKNTLMRTLPYLQGSYAFIALFDDGTLAAARNHEPLIIGMADFGYFCSSDVLGFIEYTDNAIYLDNREFAIIDPEGVGGLGIFDQHGKEVRHKVVKLSKELADVYKHDYAHFTLKEIFEQPQSVLAAGSATQDEISLAAEFIRHAKRLFITGSGTSYNAALVAKHLFGKYGNIQIEALISSESQFLSAGFDHQSVLIALSQSGESADVLDTVQMAKDAGAKIISIVNTMTSSLARASSISIGLGCGPEIGVAATKSFTSQLAILCQITEMLARTDLGFLRQQASDAIKQLLRRTGEVERIAKELKDVSDIYVLGRGVHYPIASEASLKLKEIAYIHAEGLPGGELKHGPLALMDEYAYVILINPDDETHGPMLTSGKQIKSRGAKIIGVSNKFNDLYDHWIFLPDVNTLAYPLVEIVPLQLLAYYVALEKDTDPDYPRNLAKSVTVR